MEQGIKTLHESNPNKKQKAKIVAVIAALYQAIKGGLCTDSNFPIQGDIFFFFFFKSNNPACGLDHGRDHQQQRIFRQVRHDDQALS